MISFKYYSRRFPLTVAFALICILCALALLYVDYPLARFVGRQAGPGLLKVFTLITWFGNVVFWQAGAFLVMVVLFLVAWKRRFAEAPQWSRELPLRALYFFVSLASGSLVVFTMKEMVGRLRPSFIIHHIVPAPGNFLQYHEALSFPSGHSANAFAAATALGFLFPRQRWIFYAAAALVGLSRIILNVHFVSDVLMGGYVGFAAAALVRRWFESAGIPVTWPGNRAALK